MACAEIGAAVALAALAHLGNDRRIVSGGEEEVEKAGAGDLRTVEQRVLGVQMGSDRLGDLARRGVERPRRHHGDVGGKVTVFAVAGHLDGIGGQRALRQLACRRGGGRRCFDHVAQSALCPVYDTEHGFYPPVFLVTAAAVP